MSKAELAKWTKQLTSATPIYLTRFQILKATYASVSRTFVATMVQNQNQIDVQDSESEQAPKELVISEGPLGPITLEFQRSFLGFPILTQILPLRAAMRNRAEQLNHPELCLKTPRSSRSRETCWAYSRTRSPKQN